MVAHYRVGYPLDVPKVHSSRPKEPGSKKPAKRPPSYPIGSVDSALNLLMLLRDRTSIGVSEAAGILGVAPSTAHRLFQMLRYHDLVDQDSTSRTYHPGPALIELGMSILRGFDLRVVVRPHLAKLADETRETADLSILDAAKVLVIESVESSQAVRVGARLGMTTAAHVSTSGRVLLASLQADRLEALYPGPRITSSPISRAQLFESLEKIRRDGYAVSTGGEGTDDVAELAVSVLDVSGAMRCAVGIAMPRSRFGSKELPTLLALLGQTAQAIGSALP